jgi:hypothetical protein
VDVTDLNGSQLAENHGESDMLCDGVGALLVGCMNQSQQAGFFAQMTVAVRQAVD